MKVLRWLLLAATAVATPLYAQYPNKVVRLVIPFAPGDSPDLSARLLAERLTTVLGQQVIAENRPGAAGTIAAESVAKSPADGYTLLYATTAMMTITPQLRKTPYDPVKDFETISRAAAAVLVVVVNKTFPANTWPEFVAEAKRHPGKYSYASSGEGTILHLSAEHLQNVAGIKLLHVPYKGLAPAVIDVLAGQVNMTMELSSILPHVKAGNAKPLLVLDDKPLADVPDVPTLKQYPMPFDLKPWFGVFAPHGTPKEISGRLDKAIAQVTAQPDFRDRLPAGLFPAYMDSASYNKLMESDRAAYHDVIKRLNLKLD
jgi:tripartite-type tricarboxylate transporter receptor subunit TctC